MPLMPKRVKFRKKQKGSYKGFATRGTTLAYGEYGLKALSRGWLTNIEIEACRVAVNRHMKRRGKMWLRQFPDKPITKKPIETRMGKGKGDVAAWVVVVKPGMILFEIGGVNEVLAREALRIAASKIGIKTKFVKRAVRI